MSTYQNYVGSGDEKNVNSPPKKSIDIEECKWAAKNLDHCHSARETALLLFPGLVDELIRYREEDGRLAAMLSDGHLLIEDEVARILGGTAQEPPAFAIGDRVRIKGPARYGDTSHIGEEFEITDMDSCAPPVLCTGKGYAYYPASSLELVEPVLKVGDWVEVVGQPSGLSGKETGIIEQIKKIDDGGRIYIRGWYYPASSLRKIQPEEETIGPTYVIEGNRLHKIEDCLEDLLVDYREEKQKRSLMADRIQGLEERYVKIEAALRSV